MIFAYTRMFGDKNIDMIMENPKKNRWEVIVDGLNRGQVPTREDAILYRNSLFSNNGVSFLLRKFGVPVVNPIHYYTISAYLTKDNWEERYPKVIEICKMEIERCPIFVNFDFFDTDDDTILAELKDYFIETHGTDSEKGIFSYREIVNVDASAIYLQNLIDTYKAELEVKKSADTSTDTDTSDTDSGDTTQS